MQAGDHDIVFKTTRRLAPKEGLTVAVSWPKGVVHEPSGQERMGFFLRDNVATAIGLIWLAVLLGFYLWVWYRVGRDPATGTIIPLYAPPAGFSPAGVRFVSRMGYDDKAFAAAVVDMAVKGAVLIQEDGGDYTLVRRDARQGSPVPGRSSSSPPNSSPGQVHQTGKRKPHHDQGRHRRLEEKSARRNWKRSTSSPTRAIWRPGIVITLLGVAFVILTSRDSMAAGFGSLWLTIWTVACYFLAVTVYKKWQAARGGGLVKLAGRPWAPPCLPCPFLPGRSSGRSC